MMLRRAQQEMVGFVLIVVIVIVGLVVFMLFGLTQNNTAESDIANNILSSMMKTTSSCAIVYEPNFDDMRDLFRSCYDNRRCANNQRMACDVLEESLETMLDEVMLLEPIISAYQIDFAHSDSVGTEGIIHLVKGSTQCNGTVYGSEPHSIRISSDENLLVMLKICVENLNS